MSLDKYTDEELVEQFWLKSDRKTGRKAPSIFCYRAWMLDAAPRLYKLMLDGLQAKREKEGRL